MKYASPESNDYPRSWYPVCRSADLKPESILPVNMFGKKIAIFRTKSNLVGALDSKCCHIGADLCNGSIVGDRIVCPLHHWSYNTKGHCVDIPCKTDFPSRIRQPAFHCIEYFGLIYVFWGDIPDFPLPEFSDMGHCFFSSAAIVDFEASCDKISMNCFDEQYMATVQRRPVLNKFMQSPQSPFHFNIKYRLLLEPNRLRHILLHAIRKTEMQISINCWGGNLILIEYHNSNRKILVSLLPIEDNITRAYITSILNFDYGTSTLPFSRLLVRLLNQVAKLDMRRRVPALQGIDLHFGNIIPELDTTMIRWQNYWKNLPRMHSNRATKALPSSVKSISREKYGELATLK